MRDFGITQSVESNYNQYMQKLSDYDREKIETDEKHFSETEVLKAEIRKCQQEACLHAGVVGLIYEPVSNSYKPAFETKFLPIEEIKDDPNLTYKIISYVLSIIVGAFVGNSLFSLLGVSKRTTEGNITFWFMLVMGIAMIASFKMLLELIWTSIGKAKILKELCWKKYLFPVVSTSILILSELYLGSYAIKTFSIKTSFDSKQVINDQTAFLIAMAITTASVLISAVIGFQKGERQITNRELNNKIKLDSLSYLNAEHKKAIEGIKTETKASYITLLGMISKIKCLQEDLSQLEKNNRAYNQKHKTERENLI